jgi:2-polyprenyl-3-methyl-5-hydroxy-6-metoxy-1,4-benzoquinol methylase
MNQTRSENAQLANWVPMPRYLLRCWVIKKIIRSLQPRDFIEIGAATGDIAKWMSKQKMTGTAVEISPDALEILRARLADTPAIKIFPQDSMHLTDTADLLLSMEVLEHIEDDHAALANWFNLVRPGGHLLLSVPAHQKLFSAEDEMAGHFRRYERQELFQKLAAAGFEKTEVLSYGFPLGILLKQLRTFVAKRRLQSDARSRQERTEASGVERKRFLPLRWLLNNVFFFPFNTMQMPFLKFDWSDGYIAIARKPEAA